MWSVTITTLKTWWSPIRGASWHPLSNSNGDEQDSNTSDETSEEDTALIPTKGLGAPTGLELLLRRRMNEKLYGVALPIPSPLAPSDDAKTTVHLGPSTPPTGPTT
jgi:hypothetical protein